MAGLDLKAWKMPWTAQQIQSAIGKGPIPSEPDENGMRYWMVWDIENMEYVNTEVPAYMGDLTAATESAQQAAQSAQAAQTAASTAATAATAAGSSAQAAANSAAEAAAKAESIQGSSSGTPFYASDLWLYLTGKHPYLCSGLYSDYTPNIVTN